MKEQTRETRRPMGTRMRAELKQRHLDRARTMARPFKPPDYGMPLSVEEYMQ